MPRKRPLKERAERDTGVFCREILGFDYDIDERTGEKINAGRGGIYKRGPHQQIVKLLDSKSKRKQVLCPRKARKTSIIIGKICQLIVARPNIRIFYSMRTQKLAKKTVSVVRRALRYNEKIQELWGEQYSKDLPWSDDGLIVATRTDTALRDFTLFPGSLETGVAGDRADWIILDDLVDWQNVRNPEQIDKQVTYLKLCFPLLEHGGTLVDVGTPYDESDIHHHIRSEMGEVFESLWIPTGMEMVYDGNRKPSLTGSPIWPHFSVKFLEHELATMGPKEFMANMNMECASDEEQMFYRQQFHPERYESSTMRFWNGYVVTDAAASSEGTDVCLSVLAVVLLDSADNAYLADMRLGIWKPDQLIDEFLTMVAQWQPRCRLQSALFENVALSQVYQSFIEEGARQRQLRIHVRGVPLGIGEDRKKRLRRVLQPRFAANKFYVLDTMPRTVVIRGKTHQLWNPFGFEDKDGNQLPAGMLVDHFVHHNLRKKDIVDALALIESVDGQGRRMCPPSPAAHFHPPRSRDTVGNGSLWKRSRQQQGPRWTELAGRVRGKSRR